jgi:nucleotide-binding universal stress UspA family protein
MHILIPLDGSLRAETVLHPLTVLARRSPTSAAVTLVTVQSSPETDLHMEHYLTELRHSDELAHLTVTTKKCLGDPAHSICQAAEEAQVDLILMASHMTVLDPLTGESVAETVARCSGIPILIIRPEGIPFPPISRYTPLTVAVALPTPLADISTMRPCIHLAHEFDADLLLVAKRDERAAETYDALTALARQISK